MSKINTEIGGRIRYFRNLRGKKQQELADATGKDICKIETGKQKIDIETLLIIAQVLNVELNELCNITREKPEKSAEKTVLEQEYYQSMIECNKVKINYYKQITKTLASLENLPQNILQQIITTSLNQGL